LSIHALVAKILPDEVVQWCPDVDFWRLLRPVFSGSHVQQVSDLHLKFALRPHHVEVWQTSNLRQLRLGEEKKKEEEEEQTTG